MNFVLSQLLNEHNTFLVRCSRLLHISSVQRHRCWLLMPVEVNITLQGIEGREIIPQSLNHLHIFVPNPGPCFTGPVQYWPSISFAVLISSVVQDVPLAVPIKFLRSCSQTNTGILVHQVESSFIQASRASIFLTRSTIRREVKLYSNHLLFSASLPILQEQERH